MPKYTSYVAVSPSHWLVPPDQVRFAWTETFVPLLAGDEIAAVVGGNVQGGSAVVKLHTAPDSVPLASFATIFQ